MAYEKYKEKKFHYHQYPVGCAKDKQKWIDAIIKDGMDTIE